MRLGNNSHGKGNFSKCQKEEISIVLHDSKNQILSTKRHCISIQCLSSGFNRFGVITICGSFLSVNEQHGDSEAANLELVFRSNMHPGP